MIKVRAYLVTAVMVDLFSPVKCSAVLKNTETIIMCVKYLDYCIYHDIETNKIIRVCYIKLTTDIHC